MNYIYINWPELKKLGANNAYVAHAIAAFNRHNADVWDAVLEGLQKGFPQCFSKKPVVQATPWSLIKEHCLTAWMEEEKSRVDAFNQRYPDLSTPYVAQPERCPYNMTLTWTADHFNLPYMELALRPETAKNINIPLIPDDSWQNLKTGDVVEYQGQQYVVVENMGITRDGHTEILSLTPLEAIDMEA